MDGLNQLLTRYFRDGDAAAMETIVQRTRGRLLSAAQRIGSPQDAEDSVQATYHALLRRGDRPFEAPLIAWLLTVVVRIAYRRKAIDARQARLADRLARPSDEAGPLRRAEHTERGELLRAEVARLPAKYRDVLVLRYFEGLSRAECAALLEISEQTVKTRLRRARDLLRRRLNPRLRHALMVGPWFLADTAMSAPALGVVMKSKAAVVVALLALLGLITFGINVLRADREQPVHRADAPLVRDEPEPALTPDERAEIEPPLPETFDLAAADRDRDVHGVVLNEEGAPVAGARLKLVRYPWRRADVMNIDEYHAAEAGPEARSALDGTFILPWERGRKGELLIEADGYARRRFTQVQAGERVRIVMDRGATISVTVLDADLGPVAGAEVLLRGAGGRNTDEWAERVVSDGAGGARFTGIAGNHRAWLETNHPDHGRPAWISVDVPGRGGEVAVQVRMRERRIVTGRVTDGATGAPIAGAKVGLHWVQSNAVVTDSEGRFELPAWRTHGTLGIAVSAEGYGREQFELLSGDVADFVLSRGDTVRGRVVDESGQPLEGVRATAIGSEMRDRMLMSRGHATTGAGGRFEIGSLRHGVTHTLVLMTPGRARANLELPAADRQGGTVELGDITLRCGRTIEGRVLDAAGEPVARAPVMLSGANDDRTRLGARVRRPLYTAGEQEARVTDDLGRFRFPDLAPGRYRIAASRLQGSDVARSVVLTDEGDLRDIEIRFDATRELVVSVFDPDGAPVADAFFFVQHEGGSHSGRTDAEGRAILQVKGVVKLIQLTFINGLSDDVAYQLPVKRENLGTDVEALRLELERAGLVRGVVLFPDGKPVPKPLLEVRQGHKILRSVLGKDDGSFRAEVALVGGTDLIFRGGGKPGERSTDMNMPYAGELRGVVAGATGVTLRLTWIPGDRSLTVRVVDPEGKPLPAMKVFTQQNRRFFVTDADGRLTLTMLLAKPTLVHAFPDTKEALGLVPPAGVLVVPNGQEIEIRFLKGQSLRGTVVRPEGSRGNVFVVILSGKRTLGTANCDESGRFEVFLNPDAGAGPFLIQAIETAQRGTQPRRTEIDGVTLDGPEARIVLK